MKNYPCLAGGSESSKIIISGNCPPVKQRVIQEQLHRARQKNTAVIIMDYARTGDFSPFLSQNGYPVCHCFTAENNSYTPLDSSMREESLNLRNYAKKMGYSHKEYTTMLAFLDFLNRLETKCSSVSSSVGEMLSKFRNQQKFEDFLKKHLIDRTITHKESADFLQTYFEYLEHSIIADILISEKNFMLNNGGNAFSLSCLRHGETAVLCADKNNSQDTNDFLTDVWTRDILKIYQNMPLLLIVNGGIHTQIKRLYELISTLSATETGIVYCCFDIFSGYKAEDSESFTHFFEYVLYGQHTGQSAQNISNLFGEKWVYKYSYTSGTSNSITEEWLPIVFPYEKSLTTSTSIHRTQVREPEIPQNKIISMTKKDYIILSRNENRYLKASVPQERRVILKGNMKSRVLFLILYSADIYFAYINFGLETACLAAAIIFLLISLQFLIALLILNAHSLKNSRGTEAELLEECMEEIMAQCGNKRKIKLYISDDKYAENAYTVGYSIVVSRGLLIGNDKTRIKALLAHNVCHVLSCDSLLAALICLHIFLAMFLVGIPLMWTTLTLTIVIFVALYALADKESLPFSKGLSNFISFSSKKIFKGVCFVLNKISLFFTKSQEFYADKITNQLGLSNALKDYLEDDIPSNSIADFILGVHPSREKRIVKLEKIGNNTEDSDESEEILFI